MAGAAGHRRAAQASTPQAVGPIAPCGARRELILGAGLARLRTTSRAAAHPADQLTHVDAVRHGPRRHLLAINRVGQIMQGLVGQLRQSCRAQNINHMLPGELHRNHPRLNVGLALDGGRAPLPRSRQALFG